MLDEALPKPEIYPLEPNADDTESPPEGHQWLRVQISKVSTEEVNFELSRIGKAVSGTPVEVPGSRVSRTAALARTRVSQRSVSAGPAGRGVRRPPGLPGRDLRGGLPAGLQPVSLLPSSPGGGDGADLTDSRCTRSGRRRSAGSTRRRCSAISSSEVAAFSPPCLLRLPPPFSSGGEAHPGQRQSRRLRLCGQAGAGKAHSTAEEGPRPPDEGNQGVLRRFDLSS